MGSFHRQSNIEAARIFAMSMIVIWHFFLHGGIFKSYPSTKMLLPIMVYGVDLFVLISGYFLIKLKIRTLIYLAVTVWAYEFLSFLLLYILNQPINFGQIYRGIIDPLGNSNYWFIQYYIALAFISPFLNIALKHMDFSELGHFILIFSAFEILSCWMLGNRLDQAGYSLTNFIYLYCLGHYIARDRQILESKMKYIVLIFLISISLNCIMNSFFIFRNPERFENIMLLTRSFAGKYNNPLVIITAASAMLIFLKFDFYSQFVNSVAKGALGVYLLQDGIFGRYIYSVMEQILSKGEITQIILTCILLFFGFWIISYILGLAIDAFCKNLTKIRIRLPIIQLNRQQEPL